MATIQTFEDLAVWQKSRELAKVVFRCVLSNERIKDYPFKDQVNRSSGSIMDNIAEGFGRGGNREFNIFLGYAHGSSEELRSQLYRGLDRAYYSQQEFELMFSQANEISKMTVGLMNYLKKSEFKGSKFKKPGTAPDANEQKKLD